MPDNLECEPPVPGSRNCLVRDSRGGVHTVRRDELADPNRNAKVFEFRQACQLRGMLPGLLGPDVTTAVNQVAPPQVHTAPESSSSSPDSPFPPTPTAHTTGPQARSTLQAIHESAFRVHRIDPLVASANTELALLRPKLQLRLAQLDFMTCTPLTQRQEQSIGAWTQAAENLNEWVDVAASKVTRFNRLGDKAEPMQLLQLKSVIGGLHARIRHLDAGDNELDKAMRNIWPSYPGGSVSNPTFRAVPVSPAATCQSLAPDNLPLPPDIPSVDRAPAEADAGALQSVHLKDSAQIAESQADANVLLEGLKAELDTRGEAFKVASGNDYLAALNVIQLRAQEVMDSREAIALELQNEPDSVALLRRQQSADQEALGLIAVQIWLRDIALEAIAKWDETAGQVVP